MRTVQRTPVHLRHGMPRQVVIWIEPTDERNAEVYLNADLVTEEEAKQVEEALNPRA